MIKNIKLIMVEFLLILAKIATLIKKLIVGVGSLFILKPGKSVLRLFFYKIVVRLYSSYYTLASRLGWRGRDKSFHISNELIHILTVSLVVAVIITNFTSESRAQSQFSASEKNLLSKLVTAEFGDQESDILIEEGIDYEQMSQIAKNSHYDVNANLSAQPRVERVLAPEAEVDIFMESDNLDPSFIRPGQKPSGTAIARHETISYTVEDGDTVSTIAEKLGIGVSTVLWENNLSVNSLIRPGDSLNILPVSGVTHQVARGESITILANNFGVTEKAIADANGFSVTEALRVGQKVLVPGGRKKEYASFEPKVYSGVSVIRNIANPVATLIKPKTKTFAPKIANRMTWPTSGHRITQYFSFRHFAIDVADPVGTPLYAADAGVVESAGWGRGYGNNIMINHGGGKKTRYAHMNKFYVSKGDVVEKGETLGQMGNTGWSTGPHIHFEVIINGVKYNPLNYVR